MKVETLSGIVHLIFFFLILSTIFLLENEESNEVINVSNIETYMIKRSESDVGHIVFEILAKTVFNVLCFILFLALTNHS